MSAAKVQALFPISTRITNRSVTLFTPRGALHSCSRTRAPEVVPSTPIFHKSLSRFLAAQSLGTLRSMAASHLEKK